MYPIKKITTSSGSVSNYFYQDDLLTQIEHDDGETTTKTIFRYNNKRLLTEYELQLNDRGSTQTIIMSFEYNNQKQLTNSKSFYPQYNSVIEYKEYFYENNRITRINAFDHDSLFNYYSELQYDPKGNLIEFSDFSDNEIIYKYTYEYDDKINPLPELVVFLGSGASGPNNCVNTTYYRYINSSPEILTRDIHNFGYDFFGFPIVDTYKYQYFNNGVLSDEFSRELYYEYY